jgi:hypothetical protein
MKANVLRGIVKNGFEKHKYLECVCLVYLHTLVCAHSGLTSRLVNIRFKMHNISHICRERKRIHFWHGVPIRKRVFTNNRWKGICCTTYLGDFCYSLCRGFRHLMWGLSGLSSIVNETISNPVNQYCVLDANIASSPFSCMGAWYSDKGNFLCCYASHICS